MCLVVGVLIAPCVMAVMVLLLVSLFFSSEELVVDEAPDDVPLLLNSSCSLLVSLVRRERNLLRPCTMLAFFML